MIVLFLSADGEEISIPLIFLRKYPNSLLARLASDNEGDYCETDICYDDLELIASFYSTGYWDFRRNHLHLDDAFEYLGLPYTTDNPADFDW